MSLDLNSPANLYTQCKKYFGVCSWFQSLFGKAIATVNDSGQTVYYHKTDLIKKLCLASNISTEIADTKKLKSLMVEVLHPVKGMDVTANKVKDLQQEVAKAFTQKIGTPEELTAKLNELKNKHLTVLSYKKDELLKNLQPGDIFFKKNPENSDNMVVRVQKIFQHFLRSKLVDREGYKYSHVAIYLGQGKIAEAVPCHEGGVQLRTIELEDGRFALSGENDYVVSRCENTELAKEAARIAGTVVKQAKPENEIQVNSNQHKYTFINAARSIYHSSAFGLFAKQRYLKQYIDHKTEIEPMDFMSPKGFFCSNFVAYCYQTAESLQIAPKIIGENNKPPKAYTGIGAALYRGIWARINRWKYLLEWDKHVKLKFDAKWMTPLDFRNFVVSNPSIFQDKLLLQQKNK